MIHLRRQDSARTGARISDANSLMLFVLRFIFRRWPNKEATWRPFQNSCYPLTQSSSVFGFPLQASSVNGRFHAGGAKIKRQALED